jgi:ribonuclease HI
MEQKEKWFTMHFDGACSKEGAGAGITISTPYFIEQRNFSYKFYFNCTDNVAEYEALLLGLRILKKMQAKRVYIYGDSDLILRQVIGTYQTKHPRMRDYRNLALDILECFEEYQICIIPRS